MVATRLFKPRVAPALLLSRWHTRAIGTNNFLLFICIPGLMQRQDLQRNSSRPVRVRKELSNQPISTSLGFREVQILPTKSVLIIFQCRLSWEYVLHTAPNPYFKALLTILQPSGVEKATNPLGDISAKEKQLLEACKTGLKDNIHKGVEFAQSPPPK